MHPVHIHTSRGGEGGSLFVPVAQLKEPLPRPDLGSRQRHRGLAFDGDVEGLLQPRGACPCNPALRGSCTCLIRRVHLPYAAHAWSCRSLIGSTCNESDTDALPETRSPPCDLIPT